MIFKGKFVMKISQSFEKEEIDENTLKKRLNKEFELIKTQFRFMCPQWELTTYIEDLEVVKNG